MGLSLARYYIRLETVKEKEERKYSMIWAEFRPVLLAFQKGLHKAKKVLTTSRKEENKRDWAEPNIELLHLISKKMESISNFIIFRAVCKNWRLATDLTDAPAQLPWLIWPTVSKATRIDPRQQIWDNEYFVYSPSADATQRIRLSVNNVPVGTSAGFVLVHDQYPSSIFFLNPLTGAKITLYFLNPSLSYEIVLLGHGFSHNSSIVGIEIFLLIIHKLVFPTETMKYEFVRFQPPNTIKHISIILPGSALFGYYKGRIFVSIGIRRVTWVYDASTGTKTSIEIPHPGKYVRFNFLIDAMGDLLAVMMLYIDVHGLGGRFQSSWKYHFEVYRLEHTDDFGCCRWSKLNGIGDRILFLQDYKYGFCLRANDLKGLRGNCIYFKKEHWSRGFHYFTGCFCRYDMEDGTIEDVIFKSSPDALWFVPSLC